MIDTIASSLDVPPFLQRTPLNAITPMPDKAPEIIMPKPATDDPEVIAAAERIRARIRRTTADAIDTGNDLIAVQARLGRGRFVRWVEAEFGMSARWAQLQIQVAEAFGSVREIISRLPPTFVYRLSADSTPKAIKAEVIADLEAGRTIDHRSVDERIKMDRSIERRHQNQLDRARWRRKTKSQAAKKRPEVEQVAERQQVLEGAAPAIERDGDLIAHRRRQLAELDAAWERADSSVRQIFLRQINAICATEWPVDD